MGPCGRWHRGRAAVQEWDSGGTAIVREACHCVTRAVVPKLFLSHSLPPAIERVLTPWAGSGVVAGPGAGARAESRETWMGWGVRSRAMAGDQEWGPSHDQEQGPGAKSWGPRANG